MTRPRVAVVVSHPIQHFAPLYRELNAEGETALKVFFCCDWGARPYHDPAFGREVHWDVPLLEGYEHEFLEIARRPRAISFRQVDNPGIGARLSEFRPDVLLVHGYGCRTMWRATTWARRARVLAMLSSDSSARATTPWWKRAVKGAIVRAFYDRLDGALAVGDSNRQYHQRYGLPPARVFPAILPVDGKRLQEGVPDLCLARMEIRARYGIAEDAVLALFPANLTPWKRPGDFVEAIAEGAGNDSRLVGLVVGDGPERDAVERAIRRSRGHVCLVGFVNQSAIGSFYAAADLLVLTSERDAHPLVVTEALFFGLPIVISDSIGCIGKGDTARPNVNARVFRCGDVAGLAKLLVELAGDAESRGRLGEASRRLAPEHDAANGARLVSRAVAGLLALGPRHAVGGRGKGASVNA